MVGARSSTHAIAASLNMDRYSRSRDMGVLCAPGIPTVLKHEPRRTFYDSKTSREQAPAARGRLVPGNPDADKLTRAASSAALHPQHAWEPEGDRGNVGDQHKHHEHDRVERPDAAHHLFHRDLADRAADEKRRAHRWGQQADAEVEQHDQPEMYRVDTQRGHHRKHDRR